MHAHPADLTRSILLTLILVAAQGGPLLEPDQRLDVIYHSLQRDDQRRVLRATGCKIYAYPLERLCSDHYAVMATLALSSDPRAQNSANASRRAPAKIRGSKIIRRRKKKI